MMMPSETPHAKLSRLARSWRDLGTRRPLEGGRATQSGSYAWNKSANREEVAAIERWHVMATLYGLCGDGMDPDEAADQVARRYDGWRDFLGQPRFRSTIEDELRAIKAILRDREGS